MPNPYVNKVVQSNGTTLIDISDTTAVAADVASGKYIYLATGEKVQGTASGSGGMTVTDVVNSTGTGSVISGEASVLATKSITQNGTYNASSDDVDGYSSVTVNVPTGITPTGTKQISITENGTTIEDVTNYASAEITVNVPVPSAFVPNVQMAQGVNRVNTTSYSAVSGQTITVATTGTYEVYWTGYRSSTSGTSGSCLYVNGEAHSSGNQTAFSNHGQSIKLTGVSLAKNDVLTVRAAARGTQYYMYVGNLTIVQTA